MKILQNIKNSRLLMMIALCLMAVTASADVTVSMSDIALSSGETTTVSISVTNSDVAVGYSWQGDIYLPTGLSIVKTDGVYLAKNTSRCTTGHGLTSVTHAENSSLADNQIRFSLLNASGTTLKLNEGVVITFQVKASENLVSGSYIELKDSKIDGKYNAACKAKVDNLDNPSVKSVSLSASDVTLKAGGSGILDFNFSTNYAMDGFQASVVLPTGITPIKDADGNYASFNSDMLSSDHTVSTSYDESTNTVKVITYAGNANLASNEGRLFSIVVDVADGISGDKTVTIKDAYAATKSGEKYDIEGSTFTITVTETAPLTGAVSGADVTLSAGEEAEIAFDFATRSEFNGFQASVKLPEGFTPVKDDDGNYATFNSERLSAAHSVSVNYEESTNTVKVLTYSGGQNLKGEEGTIFSVKVKAADDVVVGTYTVNVSDAYAATNEGKKYDIPASTSNITVEKPSDPKDIDGDGDFDMVDVQYAFDIYMETREGVLPNFNGDNTVDMRDVQWLYDQYANAK